jgi:hypothetical protein
MSYAIRNDGKGWRAVNGPEDVAADETFSAEQPPVFVDLADQVRAQRIPLLLAADHGVNEAEDNGLDPSAWRAFRRALRDITLQEGFPGNVNWPVLPQ